jgi:hypothetical protein
MKIAIFVDDNGKTLPFHTKGTIELYVSQGDSWRSARRIPLEKDESMSLADIRSRIRYVASEIEDCQVFVVETIKSLCIAIFEANGITIWKDQGIACEALDYIREQEEKNQEKKVKSCCCDSPQCRMTCPSVEISATF